MFKKTIFKNNLELITAPLTGTKTVTVLVMVKTGSRYENKNNNGISHFLEHMFFKGTKKRPNTLAISSELDAVGAEFNAFTTKEYTGYWVKSAADKIDLAIDIVSDILLNSKFLTEEIEREKGVIIEEINMYQDNPMMYLEDVFEACLYGDTPAGWEIIGPKENILNFKRDDFISYLKSQYGSHSTKVIVAGKIDKDLPGKIEKYFGKISDSDFVDKVPVQEKQEKPCIKIVYKDTKQTFLALGVRGVPIGHEQELSLRLLAIILGGSMSSRLFTELRERKGLAYYVRTGTEFYSDCGYLSTQAGVPVEKTEEAIKIILQEYKNIKNKIIDSRELAKTKDLVRGRSTIQMELSDNIASWYGKQIIQDRKIKTPKEFYQKIDEIKATDLQKIAKDVFQNNRLNLAIIGPYKDKKVFEQVLTF